MSHKKGEGWEAAKRSGAAGGAGSSERQNSRRVCAAVGRGQEGSGVGGPRRLATAALEPRAPGAAGPFPPLPHRRAALPAEARRVGEGEGRGQQMAAARLLGCGDRSQEGLGWGGVGGRALRRSLSISPLGVWGSVWLLPPCCVWWLGERKKRWAPTVRLGRSPPADRRPAMQTRCHLTRHVVGAARAAGPAATRRRPPRAARPAGGAQRRAWQGRASSQSERRHRSRVQKGTDRPIRGQPCEEKGGRGEALGAGRTGVTGAGERVRV